MLVEAAEPGKAVGLAEATAAPDLIVWPVSLSCRHHAQIVAVPETVLDAQIAMAETPGVLVGDAHLAIALAEAISSGWSLALGGPVPIEGVALGRTAGASAVEYQETAFVLGPVLIGGFTDAAGSACSSEFVEGSVWAWSGAEAVIAACWREAEGQAGGDSAIRGLGGYPIETTARQALGNSAVLAHATKVA